MNRNPRHKRRTYGLWTAALLALFLHAAVFFAISWFMGLRSGDKPRPEEKRVVVSLKRTPRVPSRSHTVPPMKEAEKPPKTDHVSTVNSNPLKETVNRTPRRARPRQAMRPRRAPMATPRAMPAPMAPAVSPMALRPGEVAVRPVPMTASKPTPVRKKGKDVKLFPSEKDVNKILGISSSDYVPGVASGKETVLRTKKWVGASFFLRVKDAVSQVWDPGTVYKRHDPDGSIYGFKSWFTVLRITLDAKGRIKRIYIVKNAGLSFLDHEALRAFRVAGPFPNPPPEIIDPKTGLITFSFGFLVEVNRKMDFKLFKY